MGKDAAARGNAGQFFVAGELCRRGYTAVVTLGNTKNTDILCSNLEGTRFVHIQVKTFLPGNRTCNLGNKELTIYGENFFWVLAGIPIPTTDKPFEYYIFPSKEIATTINVLFNKWRYEPGKNRTSTVRAITLPEFIKQDGWDISDYKNRWDLIDEKLKC